MTEPIKHLIDPVEALRAHLPRKFGVTWTMIIRRNRSTATVTARRAAAYLLNECAGFPSPRIGRILNLEASTVRHAIRQAREALLDDPAFAVRVAELRDGITGAAYVDARAKKIRKFWTRERDARLRHAWTESVATDAQIAQLVGCREADVAPRAEALGLMSDDYPPNEIKLRSTIHAAQQATHNDSRGN